MTTLQFEIRKEQQAINSFRELDEWCNYTDDSFNETDVQCEFADRLAAKHSNSRLKEYEQIACPNNDFSIMNMILREHCLLPLPSF